MYYLNENIENLNRIFDQNLREPYIRMDLNENPVGLSEDFIKEVLSDVTPQLVVQYPETLPFTERLAEFLGLDGVENICLVNGSAEGVRYVIEAYSRPGGKILAVDPSYAMYRVYSNMYGREFIPIPYDDNLQMSVDRIIEAMNPDIDILVVLNPNNPVGDVYSYEEMDRIVAKAKECEITILIDEAYFYFYPNSFMKYAVENDHVFITRTFSKLFSLAGLRLGYVVGQPEGIEMVQKLCTPHNVNAIAMKFAKAILDKDGMIDELVSKQLEGKQFLVDELQKNGWEVNAKEGNFVFIKTKTDAEEVMKRLKSEAKILVKTYSGIGDFGVCLRVSTGEKYVMEKFIEAMKEIDC